jgi:uncharacterized membrane protein
VGVGEAVGVSVGVLVGVVFISGLYIITIPQTYRFFVGTTR